MEYRILFVATRFESPIKIVILFSLFSEDFMPKTTFNNIGEKHIIHFMGSPVVFQFGSKTPRGNPVNKCSKSISFVIKQLKSEEIPNISKSKQILQSTILKMKIGPVEREKNIKFPNLLYRENLFFGFSVSQNM